MNKFLALLSFVCFNATAQPVIYGGVGDGVTDNVAAMNAAQIAVCATANRTINVPAGTYRFFSPPSAPTCAINLQCEGKAVTRLVKDYSGNGGYFLKRAQNTNDLYGGGSIKDCTIWAGPASHDGIAIWVAATPDCCGLAQTSKNPHGLLIDNVMIGADVGGGVFGFGFYLDGSANTVNALGIRDVKIRDSSVNVSTVADIYLYKAIGTHITGTECFGAPTYTLAIDGASDATMVLSRTCAPTIINGINTYKWP